MFSVSSVVSLSQRNATQPLTTIATSPEIPALRPVSRGVNSWGALREFTPHKPEIYPTYAPGTLRNQPSPKTLHQPPGPQRESSKNPQLDPKKALAPFVVTCSHIITYRENPNRTWSPHRRAVPDYLHATRRKPLHSNTLQSPSQGRFLAARPALAHFSISRPRKPATVQASEVTCKRRENGKGGKGRTSNCRTARAHRHISLAFPFSLFPLFPHYTCGHFTGLSSSENPTPTKKGASTMGWTKSDGTEPGAERNPPFPRPIHSAAPSREPSEKIIRRGGLTATG